MIFGQSRLSVVISLTLCSFLFVPPAHADPAVIRVKEAADHINIETDSLRTVDCQDRLRERDFRRQLCGTKTGAKDIGFGLHIMDFLLAPGWADDSYKHDPKVHGNLPKHYVEGPQICTQAKVLHPQIIRGDNFVAVTMSYRYNNRTRQEARIAVGTDDRLSARRPLHPQRRADHKHNTVDDLFYRLDMPGHIKHHGADTFEQVYLSYLEKPIPASEFDHDFGPDEKFLPQREGHIPQRMIRVSGEAERQARAVAGGDDARPFRSGRGLVSRTRVRQLYRGTPSQAREREGEFRRRIPHRLVRRYPQMRRVYDQYKGAKRLMVANGKLRLEK